MIIALAAFVLAQDSVTDYFPVASGTRWTYSDSSADGARFVQEMGDAVEMEGKTAYPRHDLLRGKRIEAIYYGLDESSVSIVAYSPTKILDTPLPILKLAQQKTSWNFQGMTPFAIDASGIRLTGESWRSGKQKVLGEERETIQVKLVGLMGADKKTEIRMIQTATYAKGLGLVEMKERVDAGKSKTERSVKLVKFEPPGGSTP